VFTGALSEKVELWRSGLIRAAALLEATIDFVDEDVPVDVTPEVSALLSEISVSLSEEIAGSYVSERIRVGFEVAIVGPPNAGKSTLLNRLAGREAAITSELAGTTRDVVEVRMDLGGLPVVILDTAGLRETEDEIERIGVSRALARAREADLRVFLVEEGESLPLELQKGDIRVIPKADLGQYQALAVSGKTGEGVDRLVSHIQHVLSQRSSVSGLATHERHRIALQTARDQVSVAQSFVEAGAVQYDLAAEELRSAIRALESLVGRIDVENLLDEIFSSFCLGK
jgi:tRNA modification GTPase